MHLGRVSFLALKWHKFLSHASLDLGVCGYLTIYCLYMYTTAFILYIFFSFLIFCIFSVVAFCLNLKSTAATTTLMFMSRTDNNDDDSNDLGANLL